MYEPYSRNPEHPHFKVDIDLTISVSDVAITNP